MMHIEERQAEMNQPGVPDHASTQGTSLLDSLPMRTLLQQIGIDVLLAVLLVVQDATSSASHGVDWRLLVASLAKTALATLASSIMRRVRPPEPPPAGVAG